MFYFEWHQLSQKQLIDRLLFLQDLLNQLKAEVDVYESFDELCHHFNEKLQFFREKFAECKDVKGDKQSVQTRYDTYKV